MTIVKNIQTIVILCLMICTTKCFAQNITVKTIETALRDASASTKPRLDENGGYCALLKILSINKETQFFGEVIGEVENKHNEYWVYMKSGSDSLLISAPSYSSVTIFFKNYDIDALQSKTTYNIILEFNNTISKNDTHENELSYAKCVIDAQSNASVDLVNLGKCLLYGIGTEENPGEATRLFEKAAKQGCLEAMYLAGNSYYYGMGSPQNYEIAIKYYTSAADKGYLPAIYSLGICHEEGKGVKKSKKNATKYFKIAAEKGYSKAINKLK